MTAQTSFIFFDLIYDLFVICDVCGIDIVDGKEILALPNVEPDTVVCSNACLDVLISVKESMDI